MAEHGTYARYQQPCRCAPCIEAERMYQRYRKRQIAYGRPLSVPVIGTTRRLQALLSIGWSGVYLCELLGIRRTNLPVRGRYPSIRSARANTIKEIYESHWLTAGPSKHTAGWAEKLGYLPPECWEGQDMDDPEAQPHAPWLTPVGPDIDDIAVDLVLAGKRVRLTKSERIVLAERALRRGMSTTDISRMLHMNGTEVNKILAHLKEIA